MQNQSTELQHVHQRINQYSRIRFAITCFDIWDSIQFLSMEKLAMVSVHVTSQITKIQDPVVSNVKYKWRELYCPRTYSPLKVQGYVHRVKLHLVLNLQTKNIIKKGKTQTIKWMTFNTKQGLWAVLLSTVICCKMTTYFEK